MSRASVQAALKAAVALDQRYRVVAEADVPLKTNKLPAAAVYYQRDESTDLRTADGRILQYEVRLYVRVDDLERATGRLIALVDTLEANLEASRRLTDRAEVIGDFGGTMERILFTDSLDLLSYTTTVRVEVRPLLDVVLADGAAIVSLHDVRVEPAGVTERPLEVLPSTDGELVVYEREAAAELRSVAGRVDDRFEAAQLTTWFQGRTLLTYTDRRGEASAGWRIAGAPIPRIERRDAAGDQHAVTLTLWRIP